MREPQCGASTLALAVSHLSISAQPVYGARSLEVDLCRRGPVPGGCATAHPPGTGPAVGRPGAGGLRVAHVRPLRQHADPAVVRLTLSNGVGARHGAPSGHRARRRSSGRPGGCGSHMCDPYIDIVSAMPSESFSSCAQPQRRFNDLATNAGAISGF